MAMFETKGRHIDDKVFPGREQIITSSSSSSSSCISSSRGSSSNRKRGCFSHSHLRSDGPGGLFIFSIFLLRRIDLAAKCKNRQVTIE